MMERYVLINQDGVIVDYYKRINTIFIEIPKGLKEYKYISEVEPKVNYKAIFNEERTLIIGYGEYVKPIDEIQPPDIEDRISALEDALLMLI